MPAFNFSLDYYPLEEPANVTSITELTTSQYEILGLEPGTEYGVSVVAVSSEGELGPAVVITTRTGKGYCQVKKS